MTLRVQVTPDLPDFVRERFAQAFPIAIGGLDRIAEIGANVLVRSIVGDPMRSADIAALPRSLQAIGTYSVGHDHIDLGAARARGLAVFNTPGVLGDAVAETAILLMLGAARRVTESIALVRSGGWQGWSPGQLIGVGLTGRTLGIVGMGDIGLRLAVRACAFGMKIVYHNRRPRRDAGDAMWLPLDDLARTSDVIALALPATADTRHLVNSRFLNLAKPSAILVNVGRGDLIDDSALIDALQHGRLGGAGLDVFEGEPNFDPRYLDLPNAFLLPHIGSSTREARVGMADLLIDAIGAWSRGEVPSNRLV